MRCAGSQGGFTLIEMLVGLVLLAILAVLLHSGVLDGVRATHAVTDRSDHRAEVALAQNFLRQRIGTLGPAPERVPAEGPFWFDGGEETLAITGPWLDALPAAGLYGLEFAMEPGAGNSGAFVFRWRPSRPGYGETTALAAGERALLDGVRRIGFAYYGVAAAGEAPSWHRSWRSNGRPPDLVRVEIEFADPSRRWPLLFVAIP